jgi:hypothetical protein
MHGQKNIKKGEVPVHSMKAYRGRGIVPPTLNLSSRWK